MIMKYECEKRGFTGGTPGDKCDKCKLTYGKEGHDACLGTLPGVMNACCGHGNVKYAYVQIWSRYDDKSVEIYGEDAVIMQNILKKYK